MAGYGLVAQKCGEVSQVMALGSQNAIYIDLPGVTSSFAEKEWKDFIDQYGKAKKVKKSNELLVEAAQILSIGGVNTVNLYARSDETSNATRHYIWIESGGEFVSSSNNPEAYNGATQLLADFAHKVKVDMIAIDLDTQQKAMDNLEKDLQKLKRENDGYHKTIEDAKQRITKAETDIAKNVQDQQLRMQEIESQRAVVEEVRKRLDNARNEKS
jgi:outer membrane murein-binding lipoprotein Lpp